MRYVFIANPKAGAKSGYAKYKGRISAACEKIGVEYKFLLTEKESDMIEFPRAEGSVGDDVRIIILGGDGALCLAATGIAGMENVELGCIPCGSGNDYVRTFGGTKGFLDIENYLTAPSRYVDAIKTGHLTSINLCSMGLDAIICDRTNRMKRAKKFLGAGTYTLSVLISMLGRVYNSLRITIDDEYVYEGKFIFSLAASGQYYGGGYHGAPTADPSDGLLDFVMVRRVSKLRMLTLIGDYKSGKYINSPRFKDILITHRGRKMKIECDRPAVVNIDGECFDLSEVTFEVMPRAVRFIVNDAK